MTRFVCDAMLGELARWLRILGFEATYVENTWSDGEVLAHLAELGSGPGGAVLLTRDKRLHDRAVAAGRASVHLRADTLTEEALARALGTAQERPREDRLFTLCSLCNGVLRDATEAEVAARVPERVRLREKEFKACPDCGQVYWQGSHWPGIREMFEALGRRLGKA